LVKGSGISGKRFNVCALTLDGILIKIQQNINNEIDIYFLLVTFISMSNLDISNKFSVCQF
jgi:hypothetical protein